MNHETAKARAKDAKTAYIDNGIDIRQPGTLTYLHGDHLGSTSLATDVGGDEILGSRATYYPYGEMRTGSAEDLPTDYGFTGQRNEAGFGLYDYNARFYDPALGRFVSADTIVPNPSNPQDLNRYAYTRNNPVRYTDPTGHAADEGGDDGIPDPAPPPPPCIPLGWPGVLQYGVPLGDPYLEYGDWRKLYDINVLEGDASVSIPGVGIDLVSVDLFDFGRVELWERPIVLIQEEARSWEVATCFSFEDLSWHFYYLEEVEPGNIVLSAWRQEMMIFVPEVDMVILDTTYSAEPISLGWDMTPQPPWNSSEPLGPNYHVNGEWPYQNLQELSVIPEVPID